MTVEQAKGMCRRLAHCRGFTYEGDLNAKGPVEVHFKINWVGAIDGVGAGQWTSVKYDVAQDPDRGADVGADVTPDASCSGETIAPTAIQLRMVFLSSAVPFIGFGFLDNFLMISCGEVIDSTFCVAFNLSTMAAAAIGNTISDCAGIFSGGAVESLAKKFGVEEPAMDSAQRDLRITKIWQYSGQNVGIIFGCIMGCCPLLWMDPQEGEKLKREKEKEEIFRGTVSKVQQLIKAEAASLMLVDSKDSRYIRSCYHSDNLPQFTWSTESGFMGHVVQTGQFVNIAEVRDEPLYNPDLHDNLVGSGIMVRSILCMPLFADGKVKGVVTLFNKEGEGGFTTQDEDVVSAVCSHISVEMGDSRQTFEEVVETCERTMRKSGAKEWSMSGASQRRNILYVPALEGIRRVLGAEATALMLLDTVTQELETEVIDGPLPAHRTPVGQGVVGQAVERGQTLCVDVHHIEAYGSGHSAPAAAKGDAEGGSKTLEVRSELVVPLFDTSRKCLGAIKCVNKFGADGFTAEDVHYVKEVAQHLEMMLEGPDAGLRRVLALSRRLMQMKFADGGSEDEAACKVVARLERAEGLPSKEENSENSRKAIDPYVTLNITHGNPLNEQEPNMVQGIWKARNQDRKEAIRRFAKSQTILEEANPRWDETVGVMVPPRLAGLPNEELYVHLLLWDYDALRQDDLIAQAAFPVAAMGAVQGGANALAQMKPHDLQPIPGQKGCDLSGSKIWISFSASTPTA